MSANSSELPKTWIAYDHGPEEGGETHMFEGRYPSSGDLPFDIDDCAGISFEMDGIRCELVGDLGGHAVYRRSSSESSLYAMSWVSFAESIADETVQLLNY